MGTTTAATQAIEARLAGVRRRLDELASLLGDARDDTGIRVERRINALRTRELRVRSSLHAESQARSGAGDEHALMVELEEEVDEIDAEIGIAVAQLALDGAHDRVAFEAAVERQLAAYRTYVALLEGRARSAEELDGAGDAGPLTTMRERTAEGEMRLRRFREVSDSVPRTLRAGVLTALDDIDRAATSVTARRAARSDG